MHRFFYLFLALIFSASILRCGKGGLSKWDKGKIESDGFVPASDEPDDDSDDNDDDPEPTATPSPTPTPEELTINIGSDLFVNAATTLTATITGADSPVYQWEQVSGPGTIAFGSATAASTTVSADTDGTYEIRCTVTNERNETATDSMNLEWDTVRPDSIANIDIALANPTVGTNILDITFPGDTSDYYRAEIRRISGAVPPADCQSGTVVKTYTSNFTSGTYTDDTRAPGSVFSYRACAYDQAGNYGLTNPTVANLRAKPHLFFTTSGTTQGNFGGVAGGDTICETAAAGSLLVDVNTEPNWKAVLSDGSISAASRLEIFGIVEIGGVGGDVLANNEADLWDGLPATALAHLDTNQNGGLSPTTVWTGTTGAGGNGLAHCSNWSSIVGNGRTGTADDNTTWTSFADSACNGIHALYCISQY